MRHLFLILLICTSGLPFASAKDANNPIDPSPTVGVWNRFYDDERSQPQILANMTAGRWFYRVTAESVIDYDDSDDGYKGSNFMVARLFESTNKVHQFGFGGIVSDSDANGTAGGISAVSVSKIGAWKFITLTTLQSGDNTTSMEFQPGIYRDFDDGWYFRSHPRMLFDFEAEYNEVPIGAGFGRVIQTSWAAVNLFFEPQYDLANDVPMLYTGFKLLF